jgi:tetratricopeptide (TPR) repeat protein
VGAHWRVAHIAVSYNWEQAANMAERAGFPAWTLKWEPEFLPQPKLRFPFRAKYNSTLRCSLGASTVGRYNISDLEAQLANAVEQRTKIDLLHELAWAIHLNDQEKGLRFAQQAYDSASSGQFAEHPYLLGVAGSLRTLAALNKDAGKYDLALAQSMEGLALLERIPDEANAVNHIKINLIGLLSWVYRSLGDYVTATEYALRGLTLANAMGERRYEAGMLNILSVIYAEANDLPAALETGQKVLHYCREEGNVRGESIALNNLAMTYLELGDGEQALTVCAQSLRVARDHGIEGVALTALSTMGEIYLGIGDLVRAEATLLQALALARASNTGSEELQCLLNLGKVYQSQFNDQAALATFQDALSLSRAFNDRRGEFQCHQQISDLYDRQGDLRRAFDHYKQFHIVKEQVFNETADHKLKNLRISHEVETLRNESEIHRLKTVELQAALEQVKQLSGLLPICAHCKKIRDDAGYWQDVAVYIRDHSEAEFSHGICPECMAIVYPDFLIKRQAAAR